MRTIGHEATIDPVSGDSADLAYCRHIARRRAEAEAGERIPTVDDLIRGVGWYGGDIDDDRLRFARAYRQELERSDLPEATTAREILDRLGDRNVADVPALLRASFQELTTLLSRVELDQSSVRSADGRTLSASDPIAVICESGRDPDQSPAAERRHELAMLLRMATERTILQLFCWGGWRAAGDASWGVTLREAVLAIAHRRRDADGITLAERIDLDLVEAGVIAWSVRIDVAAAPTCLRHLRDRARRVAARFWEDLRFYENLVMEAQESGREVVRRVDGQRPSRHAAGRFDPDREDREQAQEYSSEATAGEAPEEPNSSPDASAENGDPYGETEAKSSDDPSLIVVSKIASPESPAARPFASELTGAGVVGRALPLVRARDVAAINRRLQAAFPHLTAAIEDLLGQFADDVPIRVRPTVLLGPPGIGKTELARAVAHELGLGEMIVPCSAMRDGSLAGTGRGWGTATLSAPLQAVLRHRIANPMLILDEIEKAQGSRPNGDLHSVLLGMLDQADAWEDPVVLAPVNLSAVNWLATANRIDGLNRPLRDRLRILNLAPPCREHVPALIAAMLARIQRVSRSGWVEPFTGEEIEAVCRAWSDGSLRSLRRLVEGVLTARARSATRH